MRSSLAKFMARENATPDEIKKFAAAAWHQGKGLWIPAGYARNDIEIEYFEALGNELYGRRK